MLGLLAGGRAARAQDVVRLGNLKFAHYGAVSYMKELAPRFDLKIEERIFAKGVDIMPAIVAGEIDAAASAAEAAIAGPGQRGADLRRGRVRPGRRPHRRRGRRRASRGIAGLKGKRVGVTRGRHAGAAAAGRARQARPDLVGEAGQGRAHRVPGLRRPEPGAGGQADRCHVPVGAAVGAGHQPQDGRRGEQALRHRHGRAGADPGGHREALPRAAGGGRAVREALRGRHPRLPAGRQAGRVLRARQAVQGPALRPRTTRTP